MFLLQLLQILQALLQNLQYCSYCSNCSNACALRKMRVHCNLCVRIAQNAFALRFMHLCIALNACALR